MWTVNDAEFESVLALPGPERLDYFVKRAADWEELVSLKNESGWVLAADETGAELVPVWPHDRFARACAIDTWADTEPATIPLGQWMDRWLPGIARDRRLVAVFPTPESNGVVVDAETMRGHLRSVLEEYE